jgi:hypothetical protein
MQLRHRGDGVPKTFRHNGFRSTVDVIEQWLAINSLDVGHHE